jgi:hypothetical protein
MIFVLHAIATQDHGLTRYLAHDDVLETTDSDGISICTSEEMEKYESIHHREFPHTHVYDVNLLERVSLDKELPTILWTIGWGKLYNEPRLGTLTSMLLWSGTSVMGLTMLSAQWKGSDDSSDEWMTLHTCKRRCKPPLTHRIT